ncbi:trichohyalin [Megalobrama amblycephala]|uniref:trichohyalin n=1 Tax=Megalobrama amblycephala TaxID=75352 RepID=UPI00201436A8|nr:trichohyalin [Megalobrama amblycephala]
MDEAEEVLETNQGRDFSLVDPVSADPGEDVTLPVHLSPETSAVSMEIRWFKWTELIYQYMNGLERTNNDYEDRVSLSMQGLKRGNVSLTLRNVEESDSGKYTCKVFHDDVCQKTATVHLQVRGEEQLQREIVELNRQKKKVELDGQIKKLELEKQRVELEMQKQIMELERQIEDLERQKNELPSRTHTLPVLGSSPRRKNSIDGIPPRMSDDGTPMTPEIEEQRETKDTSGVLGSSPRRKNSIDGIPPCMSDDDETPMTPETEEQRETRATSGVETESGDPNTTQTEEETTATDYDAPGTSSQSLQRTSTSVISAERATQTQEDPGATVQMDQERRQESESTEQEYDLVLLSRTPEGLQQSLSLLEQYCHEWSLTVNLDKTRVMVFQKKARSQANKHQFTYKGQVLQHSTSYSYLGIDISASGSFEISPGLSEDFSLVVPVSADPGGDVILPVHLPSETSAVSMEIRWLRGTDLIYQYMNGQKITGRDYEDRVSLSIQELERGNVSLTLRNVQESDSGEYTCKVFHDGCLQTGIVHLQVKGPTSRRTNSMEGIFPLKERQLLRQILEPERPIMEQQQMKKLERERTELELERRMKELERQRTELLRQKTELEPERQIVKLQQMKELERQRKELELERRMKELERQMKELETERQRMEPQRMKELERQRMELERQMKELETERQTNKLPLPSFALHGPTRRQRQDSMDGSRPVMSDDTETSETEEERETRNIMERERGYQNTRRTSEENTATDQETPGTSSQVQQRTSIHQ